MQIRTDLALEQKEMLSSLPDGVRSEEEVSQSIKTTRIFIESEKGERAIGRPKGRYITVELPSFSDNPQSDQEVSAVSKELQGLIPDNGTVLLVGLGNKSITPDALGPDVCSKVLATRHIKQELTRVMGMENPRSVAVVAPGVLGQTGIESFDIIKGIAQRIKPSVIITVDALASRRLERLGKTVQMSDAGIEPGAGVGNARYEISKKTLGIPVIAIGVPTVVDASTLVYDLTNGECEKPDQSGRDMIVTPREIDLIIDRAARFIADVINSSLQKGVPLSLIREIMA